MPGLLALSAATDGTDPVRALGIGLVTVGILFALLVVVGFAILARRGRRAQPEWTDDLGLRANVALVRLDEDVTSTTEELDYAVAQFGDARAAALTGALEKARADLAAAFRLRQQLDDARSGATMAGRESLARIIRLCESARDTLAAERRALDDLRGRERDAPRDAESIRSRVEQDRTRLPRARATVDSLSARFATSAVAPVAGAPREAEALLDSADRQVAAAIDVLATPRAGTASTSLRAADEAARRAEHLLDQVERQASALTASSERLASVVASSRSLIMDARRARDACPDPVTAASVGDAIAAVEQTVGGVGIGARLDPDASIARVEAATDALDTALAGARNQEQRLAHARNALTGALAAARSQLSTTQVYIGSGAGGRGAGAEARTRLAEAARLLALAEAESDPVLALDAARASATYSRDADALARYDVLH